MAWLLRQESCHHFAALERKPASLTQAACKARGDDLRGYAPFDVGTERKAWDGLGERGEAHGGGGGGTVIDTERQGH